MTKLTFGGQHPHEPESKRVDSIIKRQAVMMLTIPVQSSPHKPTTKSSTPAHSNCSLFFPSYPVIIRKDVHKISSIRGWKISPWRIRCKVRQLRRSRWKRRHRYHLDEGRHLSQTWPWKLVHRYRDSIRKREDNLCFCRRKAEVSNQMVDGVNCLKQLREQRFQILQGELCIGKNPGSEISLLQNTTWAKCNERKGMLASGHV